MAYRIALSQEDVETIAFVGFRYCWSDALSALEPGENELTEPEAWSIKEAIDRDTEGGHLPLPMLDPRSALYKRLFAFWNSIV
jgi:hypothetical protein